MAQPPPHIHPHGWRELLAHRPADADADLPLAHRRKLDTLARLADALDDRFTLYHGVHWTHLDDQAAAFEDIDFIIVGPGKKLLLIEQVAGFLEESPEGLKRKQGGREIVIASRLGNSRAVFEGRLRRALGPNVIPGIDVLLYCPDYTVRDEGSAGLPPERIVDAKRRDALPTVIEMLLADGQQATEETATPCKLHRFLSDLLGLVPDANAIVGEATSLTTRLSGGLTEWARRLEFSPFRLRITGTAGSGKTQLALAVMRDALAAGRRPLYVCYNRPLADHVAAILKELADGGELGGVVACYHQLADRVLRSQGEPPDFSRPGAFTRLEADFAAAQAGAAWRFDELIVDEGQDFQPEWAPTLLRLLTPEGRAWWLEDPRQNLYQLAPVELPGWVQLHTETNYRSPKAIADTLARLTGQDIRSVCPIEGSEVEQFVYDDEAGLIEATKRAIGQAIAAGFRRDMIAVLSCRGRERSRLAPLNRLGPYALRAYSGLYDLLGTPIYSDGDIIFDSVMRFKGRTAPCVVLTEIDFETVDEAARRRLFVGATRATLRLSLVMSRRTAASI